ncbi:MAG: hypothetical protein AB7L09_21425 [Nitrospira sp.]
MAYLTFRHRTFVDRRTKQGYHEAQIRAQATKTKAETPRERAQTVKMAAYDGWMYTAWDLDRIMYMLGQP